MKVSVIIPVFNNKQFLIKCLDSVMSQSICEDIEVICVDDESTDGSLEILHEYARKYSNVLVFTEKNSGPGVARNYGITKAKGEYIAFMDSDDYYPSDDVLQVLYNKAKDNKVTICGGSIKYIDADGEMEPADGFYKGCMFATEGLLEYQEYQWFVGFYRFLYQREFLVNNHLFFPVYRLFEDPPFMVKAFSKAHFFYAIEKDVYRYRRFHKSTGYIYTRQIVINFLKAILEILDISNREHYSRLHENIMNWIDGMLMVSISKYLAQDDPELKTLLLRINEAYDCGKGSGDNLEDDRHIDIDRLQEYYTKGIEEKNKFNKVVLDNNNIILYGAGRIGQEVYGYLKKELNKTPVSFAISHKTQKRQLNHIPVKSIYDLMDYRTNSLIVIAVANKHQDDIKDILRQLEFSNICEINDMLLVQLVSGD